MCKQRGVSLIEVILALVILGVVAALAIPRLSQASARPDPGAALRTDLRILRVAIERYHQDHGVYPAQQSDGMHAAGTAEAFVAQLTRCTAADGHALRGRDTQPALGPYLRDGVPACRCSGGAGTGVRIIGGASAGPPGARDADIGWVYDPESGQIRANSEAADPAGQPYSSY